MKKKYHSGLSAFFISRMNLSPLFGTNVKVMVLSNTVEIDFFSWVRSK